MCSYETDLDNNGILNRYFVSGVSICGWYLESVFALGIVIIHSIVSCIFSPFLRGWYWQLVMVFRIRVWYLVLQVLWYWGIVVEFEADTCPLSFLTDSDIDNWWWYWHQCLVLDSVFGFDIAGIVVLRYCRYCGRGVHVSSLLSYRLWPDGRKIQLPFMNFHSPSLARPLSSYNLTKSIV